MPNDSSDSATRFDAGMRVRRAVLGAEYVDRVMGAQTEFDAPFQRFVTEGAWGSVWAREELDLRTRSLITIALLAALGRWEQLEGHLRATRNTGATPEEIREALLHVAVYAGVPAANTAFALARRILAEGEPPTNDATGGPR
jgi:4-carboxymuconolactone decarboxylase